MTTEPVIITNADLTTGELNGTGIFDILMKSANEHLKEEFSKGRIKGTEYSQVYLGSMTAVMAQATQFLLQRDQASYQALLISKQVELIELEKEKLALETQLVAKQIEKMGKDIILTDSQINLVDQQLITEKSNTENITAGTIGKTQTKLVTENNNLNKQGSKIDAEKLLVEQNKLNAVKQSTVLTNQADKLESEKSLLDQKTTSEQAQTQSGIAKSESVIGKQVTLYNAQAEGFQRDAEQKAAKISLDSFAIQANAPDFPVARIPDELEPSQTNEVFKKLNQGIGVT